MTTDWGSAVVVDPKELQRLREDHTRLRAANRRRLTAAALLLLASAVCAGSAYVHAGRAALYARESEQSRTALARSNAALAALARSNANILTATERAPSVGTKSWGRRFTVTMYLPRSPKYGAFDDGLTATLTRADPRARIVAVDPKLIPYGSWVWVEGLGWFHAEDCGAAIKGFRLDLLTGSEKEAVAFGRRERFVIVVPAEETDGVRPARYSGDYPLPRSAVDVVDDPHHGQEARHVVAAGPWQVP